MKSIVVNTHIETVWVWLFLSMFGPEANTFALVCRQESTISSERLTTDLC